MDHEPQRPTNQSPMGQMRSDQPAVAKWLWITLIVVAVFGGFFLAWYLLMGPGETTEVITTTPAVVDATADWKTYTNTTYGFSLKYPKDWTEGTTISEIIFSSNKSDLDSLTGTIKAALSGNAIRMDITNDDTSKYASDTDALNSLEGRNVTTFTKSEMTLNQKPVVKYTRTIKKGESFAENPSVATYNTTEVVYNIINGKKLLRFWFTIDGDKYTSDLADKVFQTIKFTTAAATSGTTTTPAASTDLTYTNAQYGFTLTFPATWDGYKMKTATIEGATATYYINIPTTDTSFQGDTSSDAGYYSPFVITVYTLDQWKAAQAAEGPKDTLIKQSDKYVFAWSQANGIPATDFTMSADIKTIIASLKLN